MESPEVSYQVIVNTLGHVITALWGANIPMAIFWKQILPPYDKDQNAVLQMLEGVLAITGAVVGTAIIANALNQPNEFLTMWSVYTVLAPYFCYDALYKLRRVVTAIADAISPWK